MVGETKLPYGQVPLLLHNGEVTLQTSSGKVVNLMLDTHAFVENAQNLSQEQVKHKFGFEIVQNFSCDIEEIVHASNTEHMDAFMLCANCAFFTYILLLNTDMNINGCTYNFNIYEYLCRLFCIFFYPLFLLRNKK